MKHYKGITFAKGYNKSFANFKKEFGSVHIFIEMPSDEREKELKIAYEVAIEKNKNHGHITGAAAKSKKNN